MKTIGNIIWHFPFFGFVSAILVYVLGLLLVASVVAAPIGLGLMEFGKFLFSPFGHSMVSKSDLNIEQNKAWKAYSTILMVIYFPFGLFFAFVALCQVFFLFLSIVGIPVALVIAKSLGTYLNPVNKKCVNSAVSSELEKRKGQADVEKYLGSNASGKPVSIAAVSAPASLDATKVCPSCAEEVKAAAKKCRYCGHEFVVSEIATEDNAQAPHLMSKAPLLEERFESAQDPPEAATVTEVTSAKLSPQIIGGGILILVLGVVAYGFATKNKSEPSSTNASLAAANLLLANAQRAASPVSGNAVVRHGWVSIQNAPMTLLARPGPPFSERPAVLEVQGPGLLYKGGPHYFRMKQRIKVFSAPEGDNTMTEIGSGESFVAFEAWTKILKPVEITFKKTFVHNSGLGNTTYQAGQKIYGYLPAEGGVQFIFDPSRPSTSFSKNFMVIDESIHDATQQESIEALHVRLNDKREGWIRPGEDWREITEFLEYDPATWKSARTVPTDKTNVRYSGDANATVNTQLAPNEQVLVQPDDRAMWWEVRTKDGNGHLGYARKDRLIVDP